MTPLDLQLGDRLALGGSTEVRVATLPDGRAAVVKRPLLHFASDEIVTRNLHREADIAGTLDHPNVVSLLGVMHEPETGLSLVYESVDGLDLAALLDAGPLPVAAAVYIAGEMLSALDYAHRERGLFHRDVKPPNVMISWDGAVKLTDFEVAKELGSSPTTGVLVRGSPCYMSPEHLDEDEPDARSDLFALGVVLYEILTGRKPYGETRDKIIPRIFGTRPIDSVRSSRPEVSAELDQVVMTLIARRRSRRFQAAAEALAALLACPERLQGRAALVAVLRSRSDAMEAAAEALREKVLTPDEQEPTPGEQVFTAMPTAAQPSHRRGVLRLVAAAAVAGFALWSASGDDTLSLSDPSQTATSQPAIESLDIGTASSTVDDTLCIPDREPTHAPEITNATPAKHEPSAPGRQIGPAHVKKPARTARTQAQHPDSLAKNSTATISSPRTAPAASWADESATPTHSDATRAVLDYEERKTRDAPTRNVRGYGTHD